MHCLGFVVAIDGKEKTSKKQPVLLAVVTSFLPPLWQPAVKRVSAKCFKVPLYSL